MAPAARWTLVQSRRYERHLKGYRHDQAITGALSERLESLRGVEESERLGDHKIGRLEGTYGMRLSKSVRLLYAVDHPARVIRLLDIGNHKEVYGRD